MSTPDVRVLLAAWRDADRRWESTPRGDPSYVSVCVDVLQAWLAYHEAVDDHEAGEIALVTDDERSYVAVSRSVETTLGYSAESLLGRRVEDLAPPDVAATTPQRWASFVEEGRQDGTFDILRRDGSIATMRYQARAHYPIANYHLSRLWPEPGHRDGRSGA